MLQEKNLKKQMRFTESLEDEATINLKDIRTFTNLASINFTAIEQLRWSKLSTWSDSFDSLVIFFIIPDVHMDLERDIAQFIVGNRQYQSKRPLHLE
ncbi:hypothetical protein PPACK8108_LOCUS5002 [Phakopsora pachyrhizi]|uniref:Uncharacterized protein n=1 Tax=Phakopsora pachyrhizi TaxID=170000 RepID=A0AAV0AQS5_PHAPC|nr:hypothetical protein PPACK8108_LOCUS5002 [Phakopsora pachyrhizi]